MLVAAGVIFTLVMVLALYVVLRAPEKRPRLGEHGLVVAGGVALPVVALTALLVYSLHVSDRVRAQATDALRIEVIGHQWWWEVRYPDHPGAVSANEIHVPAGRPVQLELVSRDVIHSFWVPQLAGKIDVLPEQRNRLGFRAEAPGTYRGQCAEFCGAQHARMRLLVIAQPPAAFAQWLARQQRPAAAPATAAQARGREQFLGRACAQCHTVRGTPAAGRVGPDLTHVGARRTLGAVSLANTPANRKAWIAGNQSIKPGNRMPEFRDLEAGALADLSAFLGSLE